MPADFELTRATHMVHSRAWGALTDDDVLGHMARIGVLFREGVLDAGWAQISDFTAVTDMRAVSSAGIRRMAEVNPWPKENIRAFIVGTDEQFGLIRMYQTFGEPKTEGLFITTSVAEAEAHVANERARRGIVVGRRSA